MGCRVKRENGLPVSVQLDFNRKNKRDFAITSRPDYLKQSKESMMNMARSMQDNKYPTDIIYKLTNSFQHEGNWYFETTRPTNKIQKGMRRFFTESIQYFKMGSYYPMSIREFFDDQGLDALLPKDFKKMVRLTFGGDSVSTTYSNEEGIIVNLPEKTLDYLFKQLVEEDDFNGVGVEKAFRDVYYETQKVTYELAYSNLFNLTKTANVYITPATVRSFNVETTRLKELTAEYNSITQQLVDSTGGSEVEQQALEKRFEQLNNEILDTYKEHLEEKVSQIRGVTVKFNPPYLGSWGTFEPSLNMTVSIDSSIEGMSLSNLLYDMAENTSQDAFIVETESDWDIETKGFPLTEYDKEKDITHYPQYRVTFEGKLSVREKAEIANKLQKGGIEEFSIDGDYFIVSILTMVDESITDENEINQIKLNDYENKRNTLAGLFGREGAQIGTNGVRDVQRSIKQSKYVAARDERDASPEEKQRRFYDRRNLFEEYEISGTSESATENVRLPEYDSTRDRRVSANIIRLAKRSGTFVGNPIEQFGQPWTKGTEVQLTDLSHELLSNPVLKQKAALSAYKQTLTEKVVQETNTDEVIDEDIVSIVSYSDGSPRAYYMTNDGRLYNSYSQAIQNNTGKIIQTVLLKSNAVSTTEKSASIYLDKSTNEVSVNDNDGLIPLVSIPTNDNYFSFTGFINRLLKWRILSPKTVDLIEGVGYQPTGATMEERALNLRRIFDDAVHHFGGSNVSIDTDAQVVYIKESAKKNTDKVYLLDSKGGEKEVSIKDLIEEYTSKGYSKLVEKYPQIEDVLTSEMLESYANESVTIDENIPQEKENLKKQLIKVLSDLGISIVSLDQYEKNYVIRHGVDLTVEALADSANEVVAFAKGELTIDSLSEETAHIILEAYYDQRVIDDLETEVETTSEWEVWNKHYYTKYSKVYSGKTLDKAVRREILGKILSNKILSNNQNTKPIYQKLIGIVVDFLKQVGLRLQVNTQSKINTVLDEIASKVIEGNISELVDKGILSESDLVLYSSQKTAEDSRLVGSLLDAKQILTNRLRALNNSGHWAKDTARTDLEKLNSQIIVEEGKLKKVDALLATKSIISSVSQQVSIYKRYLGLKEKNQYTLTLSDQQDLHYLTTDIRDLIETLNAQVKEEFADKPDGTVRKLKQDLTALSQQIGQIKASESELTKDMNEKLIKNYLGQMLLTPEQEDRILNQLNEKQKEKHALQRLFGSLEHFGDKYLGVLGKVINDMFFDARKSYSLDLVPMLNNDYLKGMGVKDFENLLELVDGKQTNNIISAYNLTAFNTDLHKVKWRAYLEKIGQTEDDLSFESFKKKESSLKLYKNQDTQFDKIYNKKLEEFLRENSERYFKESFYELMDKRNKMLGLSDETLILHRSLNGEIRRLRAKITDLDKAGKQVPDALQIALEDAQRRKQEAHLTSESTDNKVSNELITLRWFNRIIYSKPSELGKLLERSMEENSVVTLHLVQALNKTKATESLINSLQNKSDGQVVDLSDKVLDAIELELTDFRRNYEVKEEFVRLLESKGNGAFEWLLENGSVSLNDNFYNKFEGSNIEILAYLSSATSENMSEMGYEPMEISLIRENRGLIRQLLVDTRRKSQLLKIFQDRGGLFEVNYQAMQNRVELKEEIIQLEESIANGLKDITTIMKASREVFGLGSEYETETMMTESFRKAMRDYGQGTLEFIKNHTTTQGRRRFEDFERLLRKVQQGYALYDKDIKRLEKFIDIGQDDSAAEIRQKLKDKGADKVLKQYGFTQIYSFFRKTVPVGFEQMLSDLKTNGNYVLELLEKEDSQKSELESMIDLKASFDYLELATEDVYKNEKYIEKWEAGSYQPSDKYLNDDYFSRYGLDKNNIVHRMEQEKVAVNNEEYQSRKQLLNTRRRINELYETPKTSIYQIPQITHHKVERFQKSLGREIGNVVKHSFWDLISVRQDEKDLGETINDISLSELGSRAVPKYYITELKDSSEVSHDLLYSYTRMLEAAHLYSARQNSLDKVSILKQGLSEERFTNGKKGLDTVNYKIFSEFTDAYFYGITRNQTYKFDIGGFTVDASKLLINLDNYFRRIRVGASLPIAATGGAASAIYQQVEKYVGDHIGKSSYGWARNEFMKLAPNDVAEVGELRRNSKLRLLGERYGTVNVGDRTMSASFGKIARAGNNLYFKMMQMADYPISQPTMLAVLDDYRYSEEYGKFINYKFFRASESEKGIAKSEIKGNWDMLRKESMYNHLIVDEGTVRFDKVTVDRLDSINKKSLESIKENSSLSDSELDKMARELTTEQLNALERKTQSKVETMVSNLTLNQKQTDRPYAHRHSVLRGTLSFRSWLLIMMQRRMKKAQFNWQTESEEKGHWRFLYDFTLKPVHEAIKNKDVKVFFDTIKNNWGGLTEVEKRNVHRVAIETGILIGLFTLGRVLADYVDDEDEREKWGLQMLAYVAFRTINEYASISPMGVTNIGDVGQAPFMAISSANQFLDWRNYSLDEVKKPSPYAGHSKLYKLIINNSIFNQYYRLKNPWSQHKSYRFYNQESLPLLEYTPESREEDE